MFTLECSQLIALLLIKDDTEEDLKVTSSDTHMSKHIRVVSSLACQEHDCLHVARDFFLASDAIN